MSRALLSATSSKVRVRVELKMRVELKSIIKDEKLLAQVTKALLLSLAQSDYFYFEVSQLYW